MKIDAATVVQMTRQEKLEAVILLMSDSPMEKTTFLKEVIDGLGDQHAEAWKAAFLAYPDVS